MAGPIPVFTFVFAAYAATCEPAPRSAKGCAPDRVSPGAPFRAAWRARGALKGAMFAKIALAKNAKPDNLHLAVGISGDTDEAFWVRAIAEFGLGFVGAPVDEGARPRLLAPGQQIRFHAINVLDWRIGDCPGPCPSSAENCNLAYAPSV